MNIENFTSASRNLLSAAQMLAAKNNHQQITPLHFLSALLIEENGVILNLINSIGSDSKAITAACEDGLNSLPRVEVQGGGGVVNMSSDSLKLLEKSLSLAKNNKDSFVTLERLFEALAYDSGKAGKILHSFNITEKNISSAISAMRKGKTATSDSAEESYDALLKY